MVETDFVSVSTEALEEDCKMDYGQHQLAIPDITIR